MYCFKITACAHASGSRRTAVAWVNANYARIYEVSYLRIGRRCMSNFSIFATSPARCGKTVWALVVSGGIASADERYVVINEVLNCIGQCLCYRGCSPFRLECELLVPCMGHRLPLWKQHPISKSMSMSMTLEDVVAAREHAQDVWFNGLSEEESLSYLMALLVR